MVGRYQSPDRSRSSATKWPSPTRQAWTREGWPCVVRLYTSTMEKKENASTSSKTTTCFTSKQYKMWRRNTVHPANAYLIDLREMVHIESSEDAESLGTSFKFLAQRVEVPYWIRVCIQLRGSIPVAQIRETIPRILDNHVFIPWLFESLKPVQTTTGPNCYKRAMNLAIFKPGPAL